MRTIIKVSICVILACYTLVMVGCSASTKVVEKQSSQTDYIVTEQQNLQNHKAEVPDIIWYPRPHYYKYEKAKLVGGGDVTYIDPINGWKLQSLGGGNGYNAVDIFRTKDGGDGWVKISSANEGNPKPSADGKLAPGTLPYYGSKLYIGFLDANTGWVTGVFGEEKDKVCKPWIYVTHDGGYTWDVQKLAEPFSSKVDLNASITTRTPWFFTPVDGILEMRIQNGDSKTGFLYFTHDGGKDWGQPQRLDILDSSLSSGISGELYWDFSNPSNRKVSIGKDSWYTTDGGYTWVKK